ncbi:MAG: ATP-binding protein [Bacteroidales bacterium]|nr:ATP-binding protein [Bacteroidales bacterium]
MFSFILLVLNIFFIKNKVNKVYQETDELLYNAANSILLVLPKDYHDRAQSFEAIEPFEYKETVEALTKLANNFKVNYLYTLVEKYGFLYFVTSSATKKEIQTGENLTYYWQKYSEADSAFYHSIKYNKINFTEYTDRWGTFRTAIIPQTTPLGNKFLLCADIEKSVITNKIMYITIITFIINFLLIIMFILFITYFFNSKKKLHTNNIIELSKSNQQLNEKIEALTSSLLTIENKLNLLFNSLPIPAILLNNKGKILRVNKEFEKFFNKSYLELNNQSIFIFSIFISAEQYENLITLIDNNEKIEGYETVINVNNKEKFVSITGCKLKNNDTNEYLILFIDIDKYKTLYEKEKALKEKYKELSKYKSLIIANSFHDIKNYLNVITGINTIFDENILSDKQKEYLELTKFVMSNIVLLINDILDFTKLENNTLKINNTLFSLNNTFDKLELWAKSNVKLHNKNINVIVKKSLPDGQDYILCDEVRFNQVFTNLLSNAIKNTDKGYIEFGYELENNFYKFYVKDTGIGIEKENQKKIFQPFVQLSETTNQYHGSGLGLHIVKEILKLLNSEIHLESEVNKGSIFYFKLPYLMINNK